MNSKYGWLISGNTHSTNTNKLVRSFICVDCCDKDNSLKRDEVNPTVSKTETSAILEDGRYSVGLPWRSGFRLTDSYFETAKKRLETLARKIANNDLLIRKYSRAI